MFPALVLVFAEFEARWRGAGRGGVLVVMLALLAGLWALFLATLAPGSDGQPIEHAVLFFPLPVFLLLALYWVRWWVVHPRQPIIEQVGRYGRG
jgi:hypothetical protein